jgi:hypothetical protein
MHIGATIQKFVAPGKLAAITEYAKLSTYLGNENFHSVTDNLFGIDTKYVNTL